MAEPPSVASRSGPGTRRRRCGGDLKARFACPDCGTPGWVYWERLPKGMRCPACGGGFWVDARGQVQSLATVAKLRFRCPRCGAAALLPEPLSTREVRCPSCREHFYRQSDGGFLSEKELAESRAAARACAAIASDVSGATRRKARWARCFKRAAIGCLLVAVAALALAVGQRWLALGNSLAQQADAAPERRAVALAELWLAGRAQEAGPVLLPNQQQAFQTWLTLVGTGPRGDGSADRGDAPAPQVSILQVDRGEDSAVVRLRIKLAARVEFVQTQIWSRREGRWRFDAERTLRAMAGPEGTP